MLFHKLDKYRDTGLLILRVGLGVMFIWHGSAKLSRGPEGWTVLGEALSVFGIHFAHTFMGLMASLSEFVGGILLILGLFTRPACFFLVCTMTVATALHLSRGDPRQVFSAPIHVGVVFLSLILIGPGKYSLDERLARK